MIYNKVFRLLLFVAGFYFGYMLVGNSFGVITTFTGMEIADNYGIAYSLSGGAVVGAALYFLSRKIGRFFASVNSWVQTALKSISTQDIVIGFLGMASGLLIASLLGLALYRIPLVGPYLALAATLFAGYLGMSLLLSRKEEMPFLTSLFTRQSRGANDCTPKILDTSVIIDGRIVDICETGFLEGVLVVPGFVLGELRHIADSSDSLKRNRGRRGLDVLNKMQKDAPAQVKVVEQDFADITEVDNKLVRLAQLMKGKVVTNDYNLNKVCELQGVPVLNINELSNAVKPVVLPGEEMSAFIVKDGKEQGQGVAYLDDGTMIVVEEGRRYIGKNINLTVTSVLQTAAGRMIFAKPKAEKLASVR